MYDLSALGVEPVVARVDALRAEVDAMRPLDPDQAGKAMQRLRLEWTYHSNAIEGNSLTYGETRALLMHGVTADGKPLKDHLDIKGHREALDYLERFVQAEEPLTLTAIREMHKILLGDPYGAWAETADGQRVRRTITPGEFKTQPNHVVTATGETHYYAKPEEVQALMQELVDWARETAPKVETGEVHPLPFAADLHHRFAAIHPFDDGNGRMARLLMNLVLMRAGYAPAVLRQENRPAYYGALAQADGGDLGPIVRFVGEELGGTLELYLRALRDEPDPNVARQRISLLVRQLESAGAAPQRSEEAVRLAGYQLVAPVLSGLSKEAEGLDQLFDRSEISGSMSMHDGLDGMSDYDMIPDLADIVYWKEIKWRKALYGYRLGVNPDRNVIIDLSFESRLRNIIVKIGRSKLEYKYDINFLSKDVDKIVYKAMGQLLDDVEAIHREVSSNMDRQD